MKNSKKLLILVLSLVMLVCAFAVSTLAADGEAGVLTVKYQDGTVETYAEGEAVTPPAVPKDFVVIGEDGKAYKYTVTGTAWEGLPTTVTPELLGTTVNATVAGTQGTDQVYYVSIETLNGETRTVYHLTNDVHTYFSSANTGDKGDGTNTGAFSAADLYVKSDKNDGSLPYETIAAETAASVVKIILYADVEAASFTTNWFKLVNSTRISNSLIPAFLDLNGHTVTTTQTGYLHGFGIYLRIYSSVPGAHWYQTKAPYLTRMNDDACALLGNEYIGGPYASNISFHVQGISADQYGAGIHVAGGKYYQTALNSDGGLLNIYRRVGTCRDAEFYCMEGGTPITAIGSAGFYAIGSGSGTVLNCKFYAPSTTSFINASAAPKFAVQNCSFVNVVPTAAGLPTGSVITFRDGNVSTVAAATGNLGTNDAPIVAASAAPFAIDGFIAEDGTAIAATGLYRLVDPATTLKVTAEGKDTYYLVGAPFSTKAGDYVKYENGKIYAKPVYDITGVTAIVDGTVVETGEISLNVIFTAEDIAAFSYLDTKTNTLYGVGYEIDCGGTAAGVGEKFYELFNNPASSYTITLYADLLLAKPMAFGALSTGEQPQYNSFANGPITLDLNGQTLSVAENIEGIDLSNSNTYPAYADVIIAIEGSAGNLFTIKSSAPGAQIVNPTDRMFIGVGERDFGKVKIEGENITVTTKGMLIGAVEPGAGNSIVIDGGTYIYTGTFTVFSAASSVSVSNAAFIYENAAACIFAAPNYTLDNTTSTFKNVTVRAAEKTQLFGFTHHNSFAIVAKPARSYTTTVTFEDCALLNVDLTMQLQQTTINYAGFTKADSVETLLVAYGAQPAGTVVAMYKTALVYGDESHVLDLLCFASPADVTTLVYGEGFDNETYYVGSLFTPHDVSNFADPYLDCANGIYVAIEGYKGYLAEPVVTAKMAGKTLNVFDYINYVEKALAFVVTVDGAVSDYVLIESETAAAELVEALAAAPAGAVITLYADVTTTGAIASANAVTLDLGAKTLTVDAAFAPAALLTVKNGTLVLVSDVAALFDGAVAIEDAGIYNVAAEALLTSATATVADAKVYNLVLGTAATLSGTVFHTDATAASFGAGVENVLYNNNVEVVAGAEFSFTFAATDDADKICAVTFVYKSVVRDAKKYYAGSIPATVVEAISGYYYAYEGTEPLTESCELACAFVADDSKLMASIVVTDALNFVYYLQKQDGVSDVVFGGVAQDLASAEIVMLDGVAYYAFTVAFADLSDALDLVSISYAVNFGVDGKEIVSHEISLLGYAELVYKDKAIETEEKQLVYALLSYLESVLKYFGKDGEAEVKAFNKLYAEYATAFVAPAEREPITSDYVRGILFIADEQINMALRVDPDFKGEISVGTDLSLDPDGNPVKGARFIYKDMVEIDGNTYFVLPDIAFADLTDDFTVEVKLYGEVVETFTYTIADYTVAMTEQNMGYTPTYVKALYTFATLAAAYAA